MLSRLLPQRLHRVLLRRPLQHQPTAVDVRAVAQGLEGFLGFFLGKKFDEGETAVRAGNFFGKSNPLDGSERFENVFDFFLVGFEGNVSADDFARGLKLTV